MAALLKILSLTVMINANPCIRYYPNSTINYISNNILIDPFIYYLGNKVSTAECQNSCIRFNYICNTTYTNVLYNTDSSVVWLFNNEECSITLSVPSSGFGSVVILTNDLISNQYIIELQFAMTSGNEAGIVFKAKNQHNANYREYYFGILSYDDTNTGRSEGTSVTLLNTNPQLTPFEYNTKYNMSVHVTGTMFTTYINSEEIYSNTEPIDESEWTTSYAGIYGYHVDVIFHSFKLTFPDNTDNADEKRCNAYTFDRDNGECYGYYGDNYTAIETSISVHNNHDSGVLYPSTTCAPTSNGNTPLPSIDPTAIPTAMPTASPTRSAPTGTKGPTIAHLVIDYTKSPNVVIDPTSISTSLYENNNIKDIQQNGIESLPLVLYIVIFVVLIALSIVGVYMIFYLRNQMQNENNGKMMDNTTSTPQMVGMSTVSGSNGVVAKEPMTAEGDINNTNEKPQRMVTMNNVICNTLPNERFARSHSMSDSDSDSHNSMYEQHDTNEGTTGTTVIAQQNDETDGMTAGTLETNNGSTPNQMPQCNDCGNTAEGNIYDGDGLFYCNICWEYYQTSK